MNIQSIFKVCDIYGSVFNFKSFGENRFKTVAGGFASIILILCGLAISIIFGQDLYLRTNPYIVSQKIVPSSFQYTNVDISNFTLAVRIEDFLGVPQTDDYLNFDGHYLENDKVQNLKLTKCNLLNLNDSKFINQARDLSSWNCIEFTNTTNILGGSFLTSINYFYIDFKIKKTSIDIVKSKGLVASLIVP